MKKLYIIGVCVFVLIVICILFIFNHTSDLQKKVDYSSNNTNKVVSKLQKKNDTENKSIANENVSKKTTDVKKKLVKEKTKTKVEDVPSPNLIVNKDEKHANYSNKKFIDFIGKIFNNNSVIVDNTISYRPELKIDKLGFKKKTFIIKYFIHNVKNTTKDDPYYLPRINDNWNINHYYKGVNHELRDGVVVYFRNNEVYNPSTSKPFTISDEYFRLNDYDSIKQTVNITARCTDPAIPERLNLRISIKNFTPEFKKMLEVSEFLQLNN